MTRRWPLALLAAALLVCSVALPADAAPDAPVTSPQSGPPNSEGAYAYCNMTVAPGGTAGITDTFTYAIACEYGPTTLDLHKLTWKWYTTLGSGQSNNCGYDSSGDAAEFTDVHPGRFTCVATESRTSPATPGFGSGIADTTGTPSGCGVSEFALQVGNTTTGSVADDFTAPSPGVQEPAQVKLSCGFGPPPSYPSPFWPGGSTDSSDPFGDSAPTDNNTTSGSGSSCGSWWHIGCYVEHALAWFFVPDSTTISSDFTTVRDDASTRFPFTVLTQVTDVATAIYDAVSSPLDPSLATCYWEPLHDVTIPRPDSGTPYTFDPKLPIGTSGCSYSTSDADLVDLWGTRDILRAVVAVVLWVMFFLRVIRAFGFGGSDDLAPDPGDAD